jgi:hypothetical protein
MVATMSQIRFTSLEQAARAVADLRGRSPASVDVSEGTWSPARVLHHCAASIECSVRGFPRSKPWPVRAIARAFVLAKFFRQGFMTHARNTPVPGLDEGDPDPALAPAVDRLLAAISELKTAPTLAPHAVFGEMSRERYAVYHALHIADHLSTFTVDGAPLRPAD